MPLSSKDFAAKKKLVDVQHSVHTMEYTTWQGTHELLAGHTFVDGVELLRLLNKGRQVHLGNATERDDYKKELGTLKACYVPSRKNRFPADCVLVDITFGTIATAIMNLHRALSCGGSTSGTKSNRTKHVDQVSEAKFVFYKTLDSIIEILSPNLYTNVSEDGVFYQASFESHYRLRWWRIPDST